MAAKMSGMHISPDFVPHSVNATTSLEVSHSCLIFIKPFLPTLILFFVPIFSD